jgi:hypothetical protein
MTWNTSAGERTLGPKEGRLFAEAIGFALDMAKEQEFPIGCYRPNSATPFATLSDVEKITVWEDVMGALLFPVGRPLREGRPDRGHPQRSPKLTALNESAIHWVYQYLAAQFEEDLELAEDVWGAHVMAALDEVGDSPDDYQDEFEPEELSPTEKWLERLEWLADKILWDRDFEMDVARNLSKEQLYDLGITSYYYSKRRPRQVPLATTLASLEKLHRIINTTTGE